MRETCLPAIGTRLGLTVESEHALTVVAVDDTSPPTLTASVPDPEAFAGEVDAQVSWPTDLGLAVADVVVCRDGAHLRLTVRGGPHLVQRRRFVRVPISAPVLLLEQLGGWLPGTLLDLSEGGARLRLTDGTPPDAGASSQLRVDLSDGPGLDTPTTVLRSEAGRGGAWTVIVEFPELPERDATALRRVLFARQRELRARGLA